MQIICLTPKIHFETSFEVEDALKMDCILYTDSMFTPIVTKVSHLWASRPQHIIRLILDSVLWFFSLGNACILWGIVYIRHQEGARQDVAMGRI